tara:strand:- start:383 stop:631 length:249 start_codon:yes stop_codon:yes gene_type:complete
MLKSLGSLLKWPFLKKFDQSKEQMDEDRSHQTALTDHESKIHRGPKGGLYRIDANGKKVYIRASKMPKQGKSHRTQQGHKTA